MPERKKQHYVPKLYMRGFTDNGRLPSYQLDHRQEFPPTSIHNLCYENYFYSEDEEDEENLMKLEDRFASVVNNIREAESYSVLETAEDRMFFYIFLTHTHARTKNAKIESRETSNDLLKALLEANEGVMEGENEEMRKKSLKLLEQDKLTVKDSPAFPMQSLISMYGPFLIGDMEQVLLKDSTGMGFIFSDHPVALDNPMFKNMFDQSNIGFQARGLQLFCPLSSDLTVMMYDPECYQLPGEELVEIGTEQVTELNKVQLLNALEAVFYEDEGREQEIQFLHDEIKDFELEEMNEVSYFDADDPRLNVENEVVGFGRVSPDFSPDLDFVEFKDAEYTPVRSPKHYIMYKKEIDEALERGRDRFEDSGS